MQAGAKASERVSSVVDVASSFGDGRAEVAGHHHRFATATDVLAGRAARAHFAHARVADATKDLGARMPPFAAPPTGIADGRRNATSGYLRLA